MTNLDPYEPVGVKRSDSLFPPRVMAALRAIFSPIGASYTKNESDDRYPSKDASYTKEQSDGKYRTIATSYNKTEVDAALELKLDKENANFRLFGNSPKDFGAVGDGVTDDAAAIASAINTGDSAITLIDDTYAVKSPINITRPDAIILGAGGRVIIGDNTGFVALANNVTFNGVISQGGNIVFNFGPVDAALGNRTQGVTGGAVIHCEGYTPKEYVRINYSRRIEVANNTATDVREFGATVWGGDANAASGNYPGSETYHASDITFTGNNFRGKGMAGANGTTAGIWTACVERVTVIGNNVGEFTDVGIDFEGSRDCTAVGNTAVNCGNAGYAVFYETRNVTFEGNTYRRTSDSTFLNHAFLFANTAGSYQHIVIANNVFYNGNIALPSSNSNRVDNNVSIIGNKLYNGYISIAMIAFLVIEANFLTQGNIAVFGGYQSRIANNMVNGKNGDTEPPIKAVASSFGSNTERAGVGAVIFGNTAINGTGNTGASIVVDTVSGVQKKAFIVNNICTVEPAINGGDTSSAKGSNYVRGVV